MRTCVGLILLVVVIRVSCNGQQRGIVETSRSGLGSFRIDITDTGPYMAYEVTKFTELGPQAGNILNAHYFPGVKFYKAGRYQDASDQFTYVVMRPSYLDGNPNQAHYLSTAYYLRGMVFLNHAQGAGRLTLAKEDFEAAITWNVKNYGAYLALSQVYSTVGFRDQANQVLQHLIALDPDPMVKAQADAELKTLAGSDSAK